MLSTLGNFEGLNTKYTQAKMTPAIIAKQALYCLSIINITRTPAASAGQAVRQAVKSNINKLIAMTAK